MKNSVIIISILLTLSVFIPFLLFIYSGTKNTSNTKKHVNSLIKGNGIVYSLKEIWRKNFIGISNENNVLTYINSNAEKSTINNINIHDLKQCNVIKNYTKEKDKVIRLQSLELELIYKSSGNKNLRIPFFNIDEDLSEDYEIQRIEKWHKLILNAIHVESLEKIAS
ncbi:hypothetical protein SAMN05428642_101634 [Flaviramulus basaltis]|uniref:Uncharacterized protein n=1 Tax=Flaviramulus basaltis TaxID=369401 RepID=A0A1K2ICA4_9FLAO|nr:hypothetical protein [Flaviramulus basaltis]SFZ89912.1 hypothetical protein SAMN05428642_101634 [Flaviramulus basaltis]